MKKKKQYSISSLIRENFKEENNPREIWKKIEEYTNYSVSNLARVKNDKCGRIMTINVRDNDSGMKLSLSSIKGLEMGDGDTEYRKC